MANIFHVRVSHKKSTFRNPSSWRILLSMKSICRRRIKIFLAHFGCLENWRAWRISTVVCLCARERRLIDCAPMFCWLWNRSRSICTRETRYFSKRHKGGVNRVRPTRLLGSRPEEFRALKRPAQMHDLCANGLLTLVKWIAQKEYQNVKFIWRAKHKNI